MSLITFKVLIGLVLMYAFAGSQAADYYIDPVNGSSNGDGSRANPWKSLQEVFDKGLVKATRWVAPYDDAKKAIEVINSDGFIVGGDTIFLLTGLYGNVEINRLMNESPIAIQALDGHNPKLSSLKIVASSNWVVRGLTISPDEEGTSNVDLVHVESHPWSGPAGNIVLDGNSIYTQKNISAWSKQDWLDNVKSGVRIDAEYSNVQNNKIFNINFALQVLSDNMDIIGNEILNFSGDGIRGLGNNCNYINNFIANGIDINENHDDGFQSWVRDRDGDGVNDPVENVVLDGNKIFYNFNHPNLSLISDIQGIGNFDGFFKDWVVKNNLVVVNHFHGISFLGAENVEIYHNTVVDGDDDGVMIPSIRIRDHKNGGPSKNVEIVNNISSVTIVSSDVEAKGNVQIDSKSSMFVNHVEHDYTPRINSPANNKGEAIYSGTKDINGRIRACSPDIGAFEAGW